MPQHRRTPSRHPLNDDMLVRGVIIALIGLVMVVGPHFMQATPLRQMFEQVQAVAWFAIVLGAAFMLQFWRKYQRQQRAAQTQAQTPNLRK